MFFINQTCYLPRPTRAAVGTRASVLFNRTMCCVLSGTRGRCPGFYWFIILVSVTSQTHCRCPDCGSFIISVSAPSQTRGRCPGFGWLIILVSVPKRFRVDVRVWAGSSYQSQCPVIPVAGAWNGSDAQTISTYITATNSAGYRPMEA